MFAHRTLQSQQKPLMRMLPDRRKQRRRGSTSAWRAGTKELTLPKTPGIRSASAKSNQTNKREPAEPGASLCQAAEVHLLIGALIGILSIMPVERATSLREASGGGRRRMVTPIARTRGSVAANCVCWPRWRAPSTSGRLGCHGSRLYRSAADRAGASCCYPYPCERRGQRAARPIHER
jgi:hypothetical protein